MMHVNHYLIWVGDDGLIEGHLPHNSELCLLNGFGGFLFSGLLVAIRLWLAGECYI
jgi:hypothetical protein